VVALSNATTLDCFAVVSSDGRPIGLVNVLDIVFDNGAAKPLASYTRRVVTATEREPAYRVIRRLRAARRGLAAVVDDNKRLIGITTEDALIKRLVQSA
jgi:CBS domain-containing protein